MPDKYEDGIDPDLDDWDAEVASIEAAEADLPEVVVERLYPPTVITIKVVFDMDWGGAGNVLKLLGQIQEMAGIENAELQGADWQEDLL
jgi:hypothetical protein